jgi:hypothetical protein
LLQKHVSAGLYLAMRYFGYFDREDYLAEDENEGLCDLEVPDLYGERKWDICNAEIVVLAKYAGISRPSVYEGLKDLEARCLIAKIAPAYNGSARWKVYIRPSGYWKRDFLNESLKNDRCKYSSSPHVKILPKVVKRRIKTGGEPY